MDVKTCGFLAHVPTRFRFGWDEEAPLCTALKQVLLQQFQLLRRAGYGSFYVVPDSGAGLWAGESSTCSAMTIPLCFCNASCHMKKSPPNGRRSSGIGILPCWSSAPILPPFPIRMIRVLYKRP